MTFNFKPISKFTPESRVINRSSGPVTYSTNKNGARYRCVVSISEEIFTLMGLYKPRDGHLVDPRRHPYNDYKFTVSVDESADAVMITGFANAEAPHDAYSMSDAGRRLMLSFGWCPGIPSVAKTITCDVWEASPMKLIFVFPPNGANWSSVCAREQNQSGDMFNARAS